MTLRWALAFIHLLALPIGLAAVYVRAHTLRDVARGGSPMTTLSADAWWAVAAVLWIATGVWRVLSGIEKPTDYYMANWLFHAKMTMLGLILLLEIRPVMVIGKWRRQVRKRAPIEIVAARGMATTSWIQVVLVILMIAAASGMARGVGGFR